MSCPRWAMDYRVDYEPAESSTGNFGGNSNWRGPIWFPVNYLLIESLQKFHYFLGDDYKSRVPDQIRPVCPLERNRRGIVTTAHPHLSPRPNRATPCLRKHGKIPGRSPLAGCNSLLRILPWRQRHRHRRESPNGMDGIGGETDSAVRGVGGTEWAVFLLVQRAARRDTRCSGAARVSGILHGSVFTFQSFRSPACLQR